MSRPSAELIVALMDGIVGIFESFRGRRIGEWGEARVLKAKEVKRRVVKQVNIVLACTHQVIRQVLVHRKEKG